MKPGDHGTTFGGNPVACAAGLSVVSQIATPALLENVKARSKQLKEGIAKIVAKFNFLGEVRGEGLILGIPLAQEKSVGDVITAARAEGLLILSAKGNVIRLLPPLNVSAAECDEALQKLEAAVSRIA